jgi:hypothetical protein
LVGELGEGVLPGVVNAVSKILPLIPALLPPGEKGESCVGE